MGFNFSFNKGISMIPDFKLSKYASFYEFTNTSHPQLQTENREECVPFINAASSFLKELFDPVREMFGPILISSGFRCIYVNQFVGGSPTSRHLKGEAADIWRPEWTWDRLKDMGMKIHCLYLAEKLCGKVIVESSGGKVWIHISRAEKASLWDGVNGKYSFVA